MREGIPNAGSLLSKIASGLASGRGTDGEACPLQIERMQGSCR
jgi:hypothetical protein